jgi:hypothetical protein
MWICRMNTTRRAFITAAPLIACSVTVLPVLAFAQGAKVSSAVELTTRADHLKPGEWVWAPQIAPSGPLLIYVDLSRQLASVYRNGVRIGVTTVSSGKPGYETPTGVFTILQKDIDHHSSVYNNAAMPYTQRLTWSGVALHAGGLPGYPESHGCVHLPYRFAQELYKVTTLGATVIISGSAGAPSAAPSGEVLMPGAQQPVPANLETFWQPQLSPRGPVTIVMSRQDQQITVLRNGVVIGRSPAILPTDDDSTRVLTLTGTDHGLQTWMYVGVPGHDEDEGRPIDPYARARVHIPTAFYDAVAAILTPGASVLITSASLTPDNSGRNLTLITGANGKGPITP